MLRSMMTITVPVTIVPTVLHRSRISLLTRVGFAHASLSYRGVGGSHLRDHSIVIDPTQFANELFQL